MTGSHVDIVLTTLFLFGMAVFGLLMLAVALRYGPRRGYWAQPAAKLRKPGSRTVRGLYGMAALQLIAGIGIFLFVPGGEIAVVIVCAAMSAIYVLFAQSWALANSVVARRERAHDDRH